MTNTDLLGLLSEAREGHSRQELTDMAYIAVVNTVLDAAAGRSTSVSPELVSTARLFSARQLA
jgi:hypothetical protein